MAHLLAVDARHRTVIMVQVENEIGMIPHARDYSAAANELIAGEVPAALMSYLADHRGKLATRLEERWLPTAHVARHLGASVRARRGDRGSVHGVALRNATSRQSRALASAFIRCRCSSMRRWFGRVASRASARAPDRCPIS